MTINLYPQIICDKGNMSILVVLVWKDTYSQVVYQKRKKKSLTLNVDSKQ